MTLDSTTITTAELGVLDSVTPGTAAASKALVVDGNKDLATLRNLTIDGTFSDGNYTFDTSGNVSGLGTVGCGAITSTGASTFQSLSASSNISASNLILDHNHLVNVGTPAGTARVLLHNTTSGELEYATASSLGANFNFSVGHSGGSAVAVSDEEIIGFTGSTGLSVAVADQSTNTSVTYTLNAQLQDVAAMATSATEALALLDATELGYVNRFNSVSSVSLMKTPAVIDVVSFKSVLIRNS